MKKKKKKKKEQIDSMYHATGKCYLGIWKAISSRESLGCNGARSKSLLGPRWTLLQQCMDPAVGCDWSVELVPRWPLWLDLPFCRFFRTSSAWRRRLCNRKKYIDISVPRGEYIRSESWWTGRRERTFTLFVRTNLFWVASFPGEIEFSCHEWTLIRFESRLK